jgi:hypothetical protein
MRRHLGRLLALQLCWFAACFRELAAVQPPEQQAPPTLTLEVRDQNDALWPADGTPRAPRFVLRADDARALERAERLFLLRGAPSGELLEDLRSAKLRSETEMARVALQAEPCAEAAHDLCSVPLSALEAGARYTLVWAAVAGAVSFPVIVSRSPAAGAGWIESLPGELSGRVPINLARAWVRFDGYLEPGDSQLMLRDESGKAMASESRVVACAELGLAPGDCLELVPGAPLVPASRYTLQAEGQLLDVTGAAPRTRQISFVTGSDSDQRAPALRALDCARDEKSLAALCLLAGESTVRVRARSDEGGFISLSCAQGSASAIGASGDFTLTVPVPRECDAQLSLHDLAGNESRATVRLAPAPDLARVTIDEVRVDPLGPEPAQEYVELLNFGATDVSMQGFSLTNDAFAQGQPITGDERLAPGERALVVAPDFDVNEHSDGALPPGVHLLRLARALSLRNDGSALYLRDALGRRLSAAPALAPERAGQCVHRVESAEPRSGEPLAFTRDASGGCTPGAASAP